PDLSLGKKKDWPVWPEVLFPFAVCPSRRNTEISTYCARAHAHCRNQPWLTTSDCPVNALLSKPAKNTAVSATSATVVNSPSTVSFSITFLMTSASEIPTSVGCSGICLSTSGVRTKPGQMTLARTPCLAPSFATTLASPINPCLAVTYGAFNTEASLECTDPI